MKNAVLLNQRAFEKNLVFINDMSAPLLLEAYQIPNCFDTLK